MAREYPSPDDDSKAGRSGRRRDLDDARDADRNGPDVPDGWRSMLSSDYDYPDDIDDLPARDRRRAKKNWRRDDHSQRVAWLRDQRQAEPTSPAVIVVLVVVVAIVILGLGGGLPRLLGGNDPGDDSPVGLLTPARPVVLPTSASSGTTTAPPTASAPLTTPPIETARPGAQATAMATDVVGAWARTFYTRDPALETYASLIEKASAYMTQEVAATFAAAGDSTYEALKTDGGKSAVVAAPVSTPRTNTAPADTPSRITRFVNVTIDVTGKRAQRFDVPLLVTVTDQNGKWLISEVSGGTGP
jgi:hypothetical protein